MLGLIATVLAMTTQPVVGTYYPAQNQGARPPDSPAPIIVWGGSGGGQPDDLARDFAAHGHPAFALTYYGAPGLPPHLEGIPLEYFARAIRAFDGRPGVDGRRMVVYGNSRGAEAALLVGAKYPRLVHGVVATAPSDKSFGSAWRAGGPGWTWRGRPLPVAAYDEPGAGWRGYDRKALIEVQRINGPVLLGAGALDELYPSADYARAIVRRLHRRSFRFPARAVVYEDAGHAVAARLQPVVVRWLERRLGHH